MPTLIIVGNGVQTIEAGNLAPSDTDQLSTHVVRGVLKLSRRSKHAHAEKGRKSSTSTFSVDITAKTCVLFVYAT
jgi:hypothetical protein